MTSEDITLSDNSDGEQDTQRRPSSGGSEDIRRRSATTWIDMVYEEGLKAVAVLVLALVFSLVVQKSKLEDSWQEL